MIIAQEKRKKNIAEYILYMWQVENLIRINGLDMDRINCSILAHYGLDDENQRNEVYRWWENLTEMMRMEGIQDGGHLQVTTQLINDIYQFHLVLLNQSSEITYKNAFQLAWGDLLAFDSRQPVPGVMNPIELALSALYSLFLMRLKGVEIKEETEKASRRIARFLSILSVRYAQEEKGEMKTDEGES